MARPTSKPTMPTTKWKRAWLANSANKQARNWVLDDCDIQTIPFLQTSKELSFSYLWYLNNSFVTNKRGIEF